MGIILTCCCDDSDEERERQWQIQQERNKRISTRGPSMTVHGSIRSNHRRSGPKNNFIYPPQRRNKPELNRYKNKVEREREIQRRISLKRNEEEVERKIQRQILERNKLFDANVPPRAQTNTNVSKDIFIISNSVPATDHHRPICQLKTNMQLINKVKEYPTSIIYEILFENLFLKDSKNISDNLKVSQLCKFFWSLCDSGGTLTAENYVNALNLMTILEDFHRVSEYKGYTTKNAKLIPMPKNVEKNTFLYKMILQRRYTSVDKSDRVIIKSSENSWEGFVKETNPNFFIFAMKSAFDVDVDLTVEFPFNRVTFQMERQAIERLEADRNVDLLFPKWTDRRNVDDYDFIWYNDAIDNCERQKTAIKNIVFETAFPAPYIIFGPPGTGKTTTIVEAILQIFKKCQLEDKRMRILLTANSNSVCNELMMRIMNYIDDKDVVYRFLAKSADASDLDAEIVQRSNYKDGDFRYPYWEELVGAKIVICTLFMAGRFVEAKLMDRYSEFFDYLFIDECGSVTEAACLIPIAGVVANRSDGLKANIVLAGDHKQLGPVIHNEFSKKIGHDKSLLERLMSYPLYETSNPKLMTKLVDNYRSHRRILQFSNDSFYNSELQPKGSTDVVDKFIGSGFFMGLNRKFPVIFNQTKGIMQKEDDSESYFNKKELTTVYFFIKKLIGFEVGGETVAEDWIGVITPYSKQVQKLKEMCKHHDWNSIEIGSIEQFQGREKNIIILSTVRAQRDTVGFLNNFRRLNVALTRAKSLLIVIGDSETLQIDENWRNFIQFCKRNNGFRNYKEKR